MELCSGRAKCKQRRVSKDDDKTDVIVCIKKDLFSWFFENVSRKEADKLLLAEENPRGTFLIRPSEHNPNGFSLRQV